MIVSIQELQKDIFNRFGKTSVGEFGITKIDFPLKSEKLIIYLEHYKDPKVNYKITFEKILSYVVIQDLLQEKSREGVTYSKDFSSVILTQLDGTKYMDYLMNWSSIKFFFEGEALEKIKQYSVFAQNVMIDVISDNMPTIEILGS